MTIHHTIMKSAATIDLTIVETGEGFSAVDAKGKEIASGKTARVCLRSAQDIMGKVTKPTKASKVTKPAKASKKAKTDDGDDENDEEVRGGSIVHAHYRDIYKPNQGRCGDDMSETLSAYLNGTDGMDIAAFAEVCSRNEIDPTRWAGRNSGQQRMNLGNVLRGRLGKGFDVHIGPTVIRAPADPEESKKAA